MPSRPVSPPNQPLPGRAFSPRDVRFWESVDPADLFRAVAADENRAFVERTLKALTHDPVWTEGILEQVGSGRIELRGVLSWVAREMRPRTYLEVGVRRGFSMAMVAAHCPDADLYAFDAWVHQYAGAENPGPQFVRRELARIGYRGKLYLVGGNSHRTLPAFFRLPNAPLLDRVKNAIRRVPRPAAFDLITIDGDHSLLGAYQDLVDTMPHCMVGGIVIFDDIAADPGGAPSAALAAERGKDPHGWDDLLGVWRAVQDRFRQFRFFEYVAHPPGVGLAVRLA